MNTAAALLALTERMLVAVSDEGWSGIAPLDAQRRTLLDQLQLPVDPDLAARLRSADQRLLALAITERAQLGQQLCIAHNRDRAARGYADAAALLDTGRGGYR